MSDIKALKLRAEDDEDLAVIAACLHGAISCLNEMAYDREVRRFAAILVRPLWESAVETAESESTSVTEALAALPTVRDLPALKRMRAGLHFDHVNAVRYRRLERRTPHTLLHFISIISAPLSERFGVILSFQGGGDVFLEVDKLSGHLRDLDMAQHDKSPQEKKKGQHDPERRPQH